MGPRITSVLPSLTFRVAHTFRLLECMRTSRIIRGCARRGPQTSHNDVCATRGTDNLIDVLPNPAAPPAIVVYGFCPRMPGNQCTALAWYNFSRTGCGRSRPWYFFPMYSTQSLVARKRQSRA